MKLKHYEFICVLVIIFLSYEYFVLNNYLSGPSLIKLVIAGILHDTKFNFNPKAGYPISYFLGWLGFITMLITNFYIFRKRFGFMARVGTTPGWLDFHIFCGMIGPVFIIYHTNFKVDGLVAISFWSMIVCSSSGFVGRYFYIQTLRRKEEIKKFVADLRASFEKKYADKLSKGQIEEVFKSAEEIAGADDHDVGLITAIFKTIRGDFRLRFQPIGHGLPINAVDKQALKTYGIEKRRVIFLEPFNKLVGYWHAFHVPFAFFMYLVALIHIAAALLLGVKH